MRNTLARTRDCDWGNLQGLKPRLTPQLAALVGDGYVRSAESLPVQSFGQLVREVAALSYLNKDHLLFFRGQSRDHKNKAGASTLYPGIYRGERVPKSQLELNFDLLTSASARLCDELAARHIEGHRDVKRRRYIQWSILQHYEVCATPLLDITQSLLVACSFAFLEAGDDDPYVFVLGLPYVTNRVSINSEQDIVNVRLLSICPPEALRPYYQEGFVAGTDEVMTEFDSKAELDFNQRLVAKFRLSRKSAFWRSGFKALPRESLYPNHDVVEGICSRLRLDLDTGVAAGRIGAFLKEWTDLETLFVGWARDNAPQAKVRTVREALDILQQSQRVSPEMLQSLQHLRRLRNEVVHRPGEASREQVIQGTHMAGMLIRELSFMR